MVGPVHFIGLCGAGMSAVARMCQQKRWKVTGSDEGFYPPISDVIRGYGIPCATRYAAANIPADVRTIVVGRHAKLVPETNPEVAEAYRLQSEGRAAVVSFPELLRQLIGNATTIVVAGSYGKSTCTSMIAWALEFGGLKPGWFVGADAPCLHDNGNLGAGKIFVVEGDEYPATMNDNRSKFSYYPVHHLLLTSCEHDHVNVFPTRESYLEPYRELIARLPADGTALVSEWGTDTREVAEHCTGLLAYYSFQAAVRSRWVVRDYAYEDGMSHLIINRFQVPIADVRTHLIGRHNFENIVGVGAILLENQFISPWTFGRAMAEYTGVRRRLERKTPEGCLPVYSDFGSSRAKCRAGIEALREAFPKRRITVCFEPHTFSFRNREALSWYDTLFRGVSMVWVYPPPDHGASTHDQLDVDEIVDRIRASGTEAAVVTSADDLLACLEVTEVDEDVIVFETSGNFDGAIPRVAAWAIDRGR